MEFSSPKYKDEQSRHGLFKITDSSSTVSYISLPTQMASNKIHISTHHPKLNLWLSSKVNFYWKWNVTEEYENKQIHILVTVA